MSIGTPSPQTIRQQVEAAIGDEAFNAALYAEEQNTLADSEVQWREFDAVHTLPDHPIDGWEELLVYTDEAVYRWVETGFNSGPDRLPRDPNTVSPSRGR